MRRAKQTAGEWTRMDPPTDWISFGDEANPMMVRRDQVAAFSAEKGVLVVHLCGAAEPLRLPLSQLCVLQVGLGLDP